MNYEIESIIYQIGLEQIKKVGRNFNFRCYVCKDSQVNKRKRRGWILEKHGHYHYHCFNCFYSKPLLVFLKEYAYSAYLDYVKKIIIKKPKQHKEQTENKILIPKIQLERIEDLKSIAELDKEHFARKYISDRQISMKYFNQIYFTYNYQEWINEQLPDKFEKIPRADHRIVLPIYNIHKKIVGVQGRSLNKHSIRYITILFNDGELNVSGLEKVDRFKPIYVTEGYFDSLFLPNAISINSSSVDLERLVEIADKDRFVFVYDNEMKNKEIKARMLKVIKAGFKCVLWPKSVREMGKDINKMIQNNYKIDDIITIIKENTFKGVVAVTKLKMY